MRNLILLQIGVYLFLSPFLRMLVGEDINYRFDISTAFLIFFCLGIFLSGKLQKSEVVLSEVIPPLLSNWLKLCLVTLAFCYVYVVISNQLLDRRQGSEVMAEIYAHIPIYHLIILRVFEIIFYPVLVVVLVGYHRNNDFYMRLLCISFFVAFLFSGIFVSRAKLFYPVLFYYIAFSSSKSNFGNISKKYQNLSILLIGILVVSIFLFRIDTYNNIAEYLIEDVLRRVDGLELISIIDEVVDIPFIGTLDFKMFLNLFAVVPFLEGTTLLKELGMTSTKSYYLQVILGYPQFDINNSMATDLYYFGGLIMLAVGGVFYGCLVWKLDFYFKSGRIWRSHILLAFMLSFMVNGLRIEQDYFAIVLNVVRDFIILYIIFFGLNYNSKDSFKNAIFS